MKRILTILALALATTSLASPSLYPAQGTKGDARGKSGSGHQAQELAKGRAQEKSGPANLVDVDGKRVKSGEPYLAQRTLKDGKIIVYRKTKRDAEALVKALKDDGITDLKLLDPQVWLAILCSMSKPGSCVGGCGSGTSCIFIKQGTDTTRLAGSGIKLKELGFCRCE